MLGAKSLNQVLLAVAVVAAIVLVSALLPTVIGAVACLRGGCG